MPLVNGTLTDFSLDPLELGSPLLSFRASSPAVTGTNLLTARKAVEVEPLSNGFFEVDLVSTETVTPAMHYTIELRYRDEKTGLMLNELLPWQLSVPPEGGALADLIAVPSNPATVWTGTEPPTNPAPGSWWYDPETGELSEWS